MYDDHKCGAHFEVWREKGIKDYMAACREAEVQVVVDEDTVKQISDSLYLYRAKYAIGGRVLMWGIATDPPLLQNDRLEPSLELPDVGKLEKIKQFPVMLTFWKMSNQS